MSSSITRQPVALSQQFLNDAHLRRDFIKTATATDDVSAVIRPRPRRRFMRMRQRPPGAGLRTFGPD